MARVGGDAVDSRVYSCTHSRTRRSQKVSGAFFSRLDALSVHIRLLGADRLPQGAERLRSVPESSWLLLRQLLFERVGVQRLEDQLVAPGVDQQRVARPVAAFEQLARDGIE